MRFAVLACLCMLSTVCGYLFGRIVTVRLSVPETAFVLERKEYATVPVVELRELRHGNFEGTVRGRVRLFADGNQVFPAEDGTFSIAAHPFLVNNVDVIVPAGMRFVASKRGTRYYPVLSAAGSNIVPGNRVYFRTEDDARRAGYLPPK